MDVPFWAWLAAVAVILVMLAVDLLAHRGAHVISAREAATWSVVWIALGAAFGAVLWAAYGGEQAGQYFAGYLIEKSLAVDNIFVFALLFSQFQVPRQYQHRVLFYGVLGALVMRAGFITVGAELLHRFHGVLYVFGAFLVITAMRMLRSHDSHTDYRNGRAARLIRRIIPTSEDYDGPRFLTRIGSRRVATPLLLVLVLIEIIDRRQVSGGRGALCRPPSEGPARIVEVLKTSGRVMCSAICSPRWRPAPMPSPRCCSARPTRRSRPRTTCRCG